MPESMEIKKQKEESEMRSKILQMKYGNESGTQRSALALSIII